MRKIKFLFSSIVIFSFLSGCGSNRELQERAPAQFQQTYFTEDGDGLNVFLPVKIIQTNRVTLDSLYFREMKSELVKNDEQPNIYVANFSPKDPDHVMSSDPVEEYGNRAPQISEKSPFQIEDDEAILVFSQNNETKYYKITGVEKKDK